jgi:hypothetical protein
VILVGDDAFWGELLSFINLGCSSVVISSVNDDIFLKRSSMLKFKLVKISSFSRDSI